MFEECFGFGSELVLVSGLVRLRYRVRVNADGFGSTWFGTKFSLGSDSMFGSLFSRLQLTPVNISLVYSRFKFIGAHVGGPRRNRVMSCSDNPCHLKLPNLISCVSNHKEFLYTTTHNLETSSIRLAV
ncbi:hypothetical protein Hdeb2414_s0008g00274781 [Helianthus debilis subsp. tardiflorus]